MSEPQTEHETDADADAEPTFASAPWTARRIKPDEKIPAIGESAVWGSDGDLVAAVSVGMTGDGLESAYDRARLIAAAGTAAQEAREMGYDPEKVVRALPKILNEIESLLQGEFEHEGVIFPKITDLLRELGGRPLEKDALASAEGSSNE